MSHCLSCLCPDAGTPCKECGYVQIRHAPGARLWPLVRTPRTPRAELARQERMLVAALLELGALESSERDACAWNPSAIGYMPSVHVARETVACIRAKRDRAKRDLAAQAVAS